MIILHKKAYKVIQVKLLGVIILAWKKMKSGKVEMKDH